VRVQWCFGTLQRGAHRVVEIQVFLQLRIVLRQLVDGCALLLDNLLAVLVARLCLEPAISVAFSTPHAALRLALETTKWHPYTNL